MNTSSSQYAHLYSDRFVGHLGIALPVLPSSAIPAEVISTIQTLPTSDVQRALVQGEVRWDLRGRRDPTARAFNADRNGLFDAMWTALQGTGWWPQIREMAPSLEEGAEWKTTLILVDEDGNSYALNH